MKTSQNGILLIEYYECSGNIYKFLKAYQDTKGIWTIGAGTTVYPDGEKVKPGDVITAEYAQLCLSTDLYITEDFVTKCVTVDVNQNQFDALVSLCYNIGVGNFSHSTVLRKVNLDVSDETIEQAFLMWDKSGGQVLAGLISRRKSESWLYFNGELKFDFT